MRAKQSKSEERRKKMIYRQKRTDKKIAEDREKDIEPKRLLLEKLRNTTMNGRKTERECRT